MLLLRGQADRPRLVHHRGAHDPFDDREDSPNFRPLPPGDSDVESGQKESAKDHDRQRVSATNGQRAPADENDRDTCREEHNWIARIEDIPSLDIYGSRAIGFTHMAEEQWLEAVPPGTSKSE
jgi:hypothetical protein